jgi:hypothetical protein
MFKIRGCRGIFPLYFKKGGLSMLKDKGLQGYLPIIFQKRRSQHVEGF